MELKKPLAWPCVKQLGNRCKVEGNIPKGAYGSGSPVVDCWFSASEIKA